MLKKAITISRIIGLTWIVRTDRAIWTKELSSLHLFEFLLLLRMLQANPLGFFAAVRNVTAIENIAVIHFIRQLSFELVSKPIAKLRTAPAIQSDVAIVHKILKLFGLPQCHTFIVFIPSTLSRQSLFPDEPHNLKAYCINLIALHLQHIGIDLQHMAFGGSEDTLIIELIPAGGLQSELSSSVSVVKNAQRLSH